MCVLRSEECVGPHQEHQDLQREYERPGEALPCGLGVVV